MKDNAERIQSLQPRAGCSRLKKISSAKTETETFRKGAEAAKNANQLKQAHELAGRIALEEKNYDAAISEFGQSNQQNPDVLYLTSRGLQSEGRCCERENILHEGRKVQLTPNLNFAFVRNKAEKALASNY